MAQPKQIKAYKKVRIKSAKELVIKNFGPDVFALLKKRYAMYRGKDDIQATVYKFLVDNKYSYREISALTGKTHEAIRRAINKKILSTKYPVPSLEVIQKQEKEERLKLERPRGIVPEVGQLAPEMIAVAPVMSVEEEEEPISEAQTLDPKSQHPIKPQISKPEVVQEVVQKESILDKMLEEARDSSANAVASVEEEVKVPIKVELMPDQVLSTKGLSTEYQTSVGVPSASGEEKKTSNLKIGKKTKLQSSDSKFQIPDSKFRYNFFPALAMGAAVLLLVLGVGFFGILPRFEKLNSLIAGLEDKLRSEMAQIGNLGQKGEKSWWEADDTEEGKTYLVLRLEDGTLVRAEVVEGEVTDEKLTADSVVRMEGGETVVLKSNIGEGDITEWHLASGSVEKAEIKNGVVTTKKLANGSVTNVKIARGTITGSRIKNYTVAGEDIASDGSVVKSIAGDGAVTATNNNDGSYSLVLKPTCSNNQILKWNETAGEWECAEDGGGGSSGGGIPLDANFGGDVSGTYGAIAVTDDSHTHTSATLPAATSYLGSTIETGEITNDTILEVDLSTSNAPAAGQVLTYNAGTGGFTWANDAGGISYTAGAGLDLTVAEFSTDLLSTGGLQVSGADNELGIKLDGATLALGAGGLKIADTYDDNFLTTSTGLQLTGGTLTGTLTLNDNDGASNDVNLNIGDANETGQIVFYDGSANTGTLSQDSIGADAVYTLTGATGYLLTSANYTSYLAHDSITGAGTVDTTAEVQAVAVGGDLSGTVGNAAVGDDSHAHTTTTISGLDISADTNLSGDTEIVLTDDALSIASSITRDSELAAYLQLAGGTMTGNLTIQKADPTLVLDTLTATDTDFWLGVTEDAGGDDDDKFQIGDGTTPGTNPFLTIDTSGQVGIGTVSPGGMVEIDTGTSSGIALLIDQDDTDATALDFDINNVSGDILNMDWGGATTLTGALQGIDVDFTNVTADGTNAAYGIHVNDFNALTASAEYGVYVQGTNFDYSVVTEGDVLLNNAAAELVILESAGATYYGTLDVGDLGANATYTFSGVSGTVVTTTTEAVFTGSARHSRRIQLNAEYAGAVVSTFYGSGTDASITGNMTSDAEPSADLLRTYYEWNSSEAALNYYTVAVRVTLPQDFDAWATSNAVQVDLDTETTDAANNVLGVYIYNGDDTPGSAVATSTGNKSSVADTWTTVTIDDSVIDDGAAPDWDAAGETAVIYLRLGSKSDNFARVGDIKLNYLSKW